jgi:hypothetical protein
MSHLNLGHLFSDISVILGQVSQKGQVFQRLSVPVLGSEPSRGFGEERTSDGEHTTGDELDGKGDDPLFVTVRDVLGDTIVDPETDDGTDLPTGFVETDETTTDGRGRDLGNVDGLEGGVNSIRFIRGSVFTLRLTVKLRATPTPQPTMNLPAYMIPRPVLLLATTWRTAPTQKMTAQKVRPHFLPSQ